MHASQLIEVGALIALRGTHFIRNQDPDRENRSDSYWTASKCRLDRWARTLKMFTDDLDDTERSHDPWPAIEIVVAEILLSELLTRVWTAVATYHDREAQTTCLEPVAKSVWIGHLEARNRALTLILRAKEAGHPVAERMNLLRRRVERWTDLVLGQLQLQYDVTEFSFDPARLREFTDDLIELKDIRCEEQEYFAASIRSTFSEVEMRFSANPDLNEQVVAGVLAHFPADHIDAIGGLESLWLTRLDQKTAETQVMIDQYLEIL